MAPICHFFYFLFIAIKSLFSVLLIESFETLQRL